MSESFCGSLTKEMPLFLMCGGKTIIFLIIIIIAATYIAGYILFKILIDLPLTVTLEYRQYPYTHISDKETEAKSG